MKGQITITINESGSVNFRGNVLLKRNADKYELISGLAKCLGINDTTLWAECVVYCLGRIADLEGLERTEIVLPDMKKENLNEG